MGMIFWGFNLAHWEQALIAINFLDLRHSKQIRRRMRHLFNRKGMCCDEVNLLRGVCSAMLSSVQQGKERGG
jgi:tRNA/rRNA methyltransferase